MQGVCLLVATKTKKHILTDQSYFSYFGQHSFKILILVNFLKEFHAKLSYFRQCCLKKNVLMNSRDTNFCGTQVLILTDLKCYDALSRKNHA